MTRTVRSVGDARHDTATTAGTILAQCGQRSWTSCVMPESLSVSAKRGNHVNAFWADVVTLVRRAYPIYP